MASMMDEPPPRFPDEMWPEGATTAKPASTKVRKIRDDVEIDEDGAPLPQAFSEDALAARRELALCS